jgi:protein involved in polysaccharide export with SLBB domain
MMLSFARGVLSGIGTLLLFVAVTGDGFAATRNHGVRLPEKPVISVPRPQGTLALDDLLKIKVQISVQDAPDLSGSFRVDPAGGIDFPYLGRLTISGLKPAEVAKQIAEGLKRADIAASIVTVDVDWARR